MPGKAWCFSVQFGQASDVGRAAVLLIGRREAVQGASEPPFCPATGFSLVGSKSGCTGKWRFNLLPLSSTMVFVFIKERNTKKLRILRTRVDKNYTLHSIAAELYLVSSVSEYTASAVDLSTNGT